MGEGSRKFNKNKTIEQNTAINKIQNVQIVRSIKTQKHWSLCSRLKSYSCLLWNRKQKSIDLSLAWSFWRDSQGSNDHILMEHKKTTTWHNSLPTSYCIVVYISYFLIQELNSNCFTKENCKVTIKVNTFISSWHITWHMLSGMQNLILQLISVRHAMRTKWPSTFYDNSLYRLHTEFEHFRLLLTPPTPPLPFIYPLHC